MDLSLQAAKFARPPKSIKRGSNKMTITEETRRRFLGCFTGIGLSGTLLPGVLWAQMQRDGAQKAMLQAVNTNLNRYDALRALHIPNDVSPPFYFSAIIPGMKVNRTR